MRSAYARSRAAFAPSPNSRSTASRYAFSRTVGALAPLAAAVGPSFASAARARALLVPPERLVVRQRLAPVRHREPGIDALCLAEGFNRVVVLEAVKQEHAAYERRLRLRGTRCGKRDAAEGRGLGRERDPGGQHPRRTTQNPQKPQRAIILCEFREFSVQPSSF